MSVELPKDAEGCEIPLDTTVLFDKDGKELCVKRIEFDPFGKEWSFAVRIDSVSRLVVYRRPCVVYLEKPAPPDSWEKLLEDLDEAASNMCCASCTYFGEDDADCDTCTIGDISSCDSAAMSDVASRIRKLRGEGE